MRNNRSRRPSRLAITKRLGLVVALVLVAGPLAAPLNAFATKIGDSFDVAYAAASEGMVLLENNNDVLPIKSNQTVSIFGRVQVDTVKSGSGSANVGNDPLTANILDAIRQRGTITINEELAGIYEAWSAANPTPPLNSGSTENTGLIKNFTEMPLTQEVVDKAVSKSDFAVVVIGRMSGEGGDRHAEAGDWYLSNTEKDMLRKVTDAFDQVVVVLNVCSIMDMNWVDTYGVDGVLLAWVPGVEAGGFPIADALSGAVNPSGKLPDTIAVNYNDYPSSQDFGKVDQPYKEDIYVGYRYFETFKIPVKYEFGFGLSYTDFDQEVTEFSASGNEITVSVKVTNTGNAAGKDVVQVYYSAPQGLLGKPAKELAAYAKTDLLEPGEYQTLTISYAKRQMAAYDDAGKVAKSAYVMEAGDYNIYAGDSVKNVVKAGTYTLAVTETTQQLTEQMAPVSGTTWKRLTADGKTEAVPTRTVPLSGITYDTVTAIPYTGDAGKKLIDVYNGTITMDAFIAQLPEDDLIRLTNGLGMSGQTPAAQLATGVAGGFGYFPAWGVSAVGVADGPIGLRAGGNTTALPIATLLAATWNQELLEKVGDMVAREMLLNGVEWWLAPALNIHRDPFCGRNYEYFSEDPLISGTAAAAVIRGVQANGIGVTPKHFAANNQETDRSNSDSQMSERALREIYLKGFEIAVKTSKPWAMMTSYNKINGSWAASNYELVTNILRKEWGFDGVAMTDWFSKSDDGNGSIVRAQTDLFMPAGAYNPSTLKANLGAGKVTLGEIQRSVKNTLTAVMKSVRFGAENGLSNNGEYVAPESYFSTAKSLIAEIPQSLTLSQVTALLQKNDTLQLTASSAFLGNSIEWTSSNPSVASVDNGLVSAKSAGQAVVTASIDDIVATCSITVQESPGVSALGALVALADVLVADQYSPVSWARVEAALTAAKAVLASAGSTPTQVDAAIAALSQALGLLEPPTPPKPGLPVVKSTLAALLAKSPVAGVSSDYTQASWLAYQKALATAQTVAANPKATQAQVDAAVLGLVKAVAGLVKAVAGPVTAVAGPDGSGSSGVGALANAGSSVVKVKLSQKRLTVVKKKAVTVKAGVYLKNGAASYKGAVTWKSSNRKIAKVNQNGKITGVKAGTATITITSKAKAANGKTLKATIKVKVVAKKPKVKVSKVRATVPKTMTVGQVSFITGKYTSAKATGVKVTYSTTKDQVVAVDKVGRLVAKSKGTSTITIKAGGKTKKYTVTVN